MDSSCRPCTHTVENYFAQKIHSPKVGALHGRGKSRRWWPLLTLASFWGWHTALLDDLWHSMPVNWWIYVLICRVVASCVIAWTCKMYQERQFHTDSTGRSTIQVHVFRTERTQRLFIKIVDAPRDSNFQLTLKFSFTFSPQFLPPVGPNWRVIPDNTVVSRWRVYRLPNGTHLQQQTKWA